MTVAVPVMEIGVVGVLAPEALVPVKVGVRLGHGSRMLVLVMRVMHVTMFMFSFLMDMLMFMAFRQMKPQADRHQNACDDQSQGNRIPQHQDRKRCASEGCQ